MTTATKQSVRRSKQKARRIATPVAEPPAPDQPPASEVAEPPVLSEPVAPAQQVAPTMAIDEPNPPTDEESEEESGQQPDSTIPGTRNYDRREQRIYLGELADKVNGLDDAEEPFASYMVEFKITPALRTELKTQIETCHNLVADRRQKMADKMAAIDQMRRQRRELTLLNSTYRQLARTVIIDPAGRRALALDIRFPAKTRLYIDLTREIVRASRQDPYATLLATVEIDETYLDDIEARVNVLEMLYEARQRASHAAVQATNTRDEGFRTLHQFARVLTVRMNALLRTHPEIPRPMGFDE